MRIFKVFILISILFTLNFLLLSQASIDTNEILDDNDEKIDKVLGNGEKKGFRGIKLGMDIKEIKDILLMDPYFNYRGDPDISFLPVTEQTLIECEGNSYIQRAYFQFHNKKLFIFIIVLDRSKLDYYTLFTTLKNKYGEFLSFSPDEVIWVLDNTRLSLEKPLNVKYIDQVLFEEIKSKSKAEKDFEIISQKNFLKEF